MCAATARRGRLAVVAGVVGALALAGCAGQSSSGDTAQNVAGSAAQPGILATGKPQGLSGTVDNPYFPLTPGTKRVYRSVSEGQQEEIVVHVLHRTKRVLGTDAVVVHDRVTTNGELAEDTYDWYAQDRDGNVWYLGEKTKDYENGKVVSTEGSWEAGVGGAEPGIVMPADPRPGQAYRLEYLAGKAEDRARVLSTNEVITVQAGHFTDAVMTRDTSPLEPKVNEYKLYAKGIGPVFEIMVSGGSGAAELVSTTGH